MPTAEEFDEFYVASRRRMVLQTFALSGDLGASRIAVRDAFIAARHHWAKVGVLADRDGWIRPRAWAAAQRRHSVRPWHRERGLSAAQTALLEALHELPDAHRKALVLDQLADLTAADAGRELGIPVERFDAHRDAAVEAMTTALGCPATELASRLGVLDEALEDVKLPRPTIIRRNGLRRRRNHALIGSALVGLFTVGAGAFVAVAEPAHAPPRAGALVAKKMLLTPEQLAPMASGTWTLTDTSDNTEGRGINNDCQTARFADDAGLGTWVRHFAGAGTPTRGLVQTVEISNSPGAARNAFKATLGWYAGCTVARIQLIDSYAVQGVGEEAVVLRMRIPAKQDRSFVVGIARTGALTTSTVLETRSSKTPAAAGLANVLATSVRNLCDSPVAGDCVGTLALRGTLPPASGETAGMLAIADLPAIANVNQPWVGTAAAPATTAAATTCDRADFTKAGAVNAQTRSYLIPQAKLPRRFGITQTIGTFPTAKAAAKFVATIETRMKTCEKKELGSTVTQAVIHNGGAGGSEFALWRLVSQVNQRQETVAYWMGAIRTGRSVAQVTMTPVQKYDVSQATFRALVSRARDRLYGVTTG